MDGGGGFVGRALLSGRRGACTMGFMGTMRDGTFFGAPDWYVHGDASNGLCPGGAGSRCILTVVGVGAQGGPQEGAWLH